MKSQRLLYNPTDPHQAGSSVWLIDTYTKQDKDKNKPKWVKWLKIRKKWLNEQAESCGGRENLTCAICGKTGLHVSTPHRNKLATIDHFFPVSKYPELWSLPENFQVACYKCNQKKSNKC